MKNILLLITLSLSLIACDKLEKADKSMDAVQKMNGKMDSMNSNMTTMERKMGIGVALQNYAEVQNYDIVDPIPLKLGAWAKTVAEYMTLEELMEWSHAELKLVDEGKTLKSVNNEGERIPFTIQEKAKLNDQKKLRVTFLEMVAGQLSPAQTEAVIVESRTGSYAPTARKMMMLRYAFLKDFRFEGSRMHETFINVAMAQAAFDELDKADYLARVDTDNIFAFETTGLKRLTDEEEEDPNYHWQIDRTDLKSSWSLLLERLESDMQNTENTGAGAKNRDLNSTQRIQALKSQINSRLDYWNKNHTQP